MKSTFAIAALAGLATITNAQVDINEVSGSTPGADYEFIELYNGGGSAVDLTGWTLELWDSDTENAGYGMADGASPIDLSGSIEAGGYWTIGNNNAVSIWGAGAFDAFFGANAIENSSYTMVLRDGANLVVQSLFIVDDDTDNPNVANVGGTPITPDSVIGPDGTFTPGGYYRVGDGSSEWGIYGFNDIEFDATPGAANVPAPGSLALLGLGGLATTRRRR